MPMPMPMPMTPDVNVLIAAARPDHPHHDTAKGWLDAAAASVTAELLLFPMVLASFLRLVINPKVFAHAASPARAFAFITKLVDAPSARIGLQGAEWNRLQAICMAVKLKPNDVPDIWLAAAVMENGEHLVTFDPGFRRFLGRSELTVLK